MPTTIIRPNPQVAANARAQSLVPSEYGPSDVIERNYDAYQFIEMGTTGLNHWGYDVFEEFLPQLQWPQAASIYAEMASNDPTIGAVLYMMAQLIRQVTWRVDAASDSQADQAAAEFLKQCMDDMSVSWDDTISEILSYFTYGWSYHEIVYKVRRGPDQPLAQYRSQYTDGRIGWRKIPVRAQHTLFGWEFDDIDGGVIGMYQQAPPYYRVTYIPLVKSLLFRTQITRDNPEGKSLLRNAYRPWYFKKRIEEIEGIGIERDLAGLPVLTPPENVDIWDPNNQDAVRLRTQAEQIVRNVRRDKSEGVVKPNGWTFELMNTGGARQFDTNAIINRYDQRIAVTMLADIIMIGTSSNGSFALADVKKGLLATSLQTQVNNIASVFNKYAVPTLFKLNSFPGVTGLPKIVAGQVDVPGLKELGDFFRATGMKLDDDLELTNYLRQIAAMPELTEAEFQELQRKREALRNQTAQATLNRTNSAERDKETGGTGSPKGNKIEENRQMEA
jgi:hypothetical protein